MAEMTGKRGGGLTVGTRFYSEADMLRMQRNAEERVREMQLQARQRAQADNNSTADSPLPKADASPSAQAFSAPSFAQGAVDANAKVGAANFGAATFSTGASSPPHAGTTILDDLIGSLGTDQDTLLIIGLLLILINQKADTTLILALAYLLLPV